jgi:PAS domain S-box-containing protein
LDALTSHIAVVNPSGTVVATNKAWDDFAEWNDCLPLPRVPVGANIFDIRSAEAVQGNAVSAAVVAGIGSVLRKEKRFSEIQYSAEVGGNRRWFLLRISYAGTEYPKLVLSHSDITEIKLAEQETERTKERYRELLDHTGEMVNFVGADGTLIWVNNAWKKSLHYTDDDIAKMKISDVFGPETAKGFGERMTTLRSGKTISDHYATMVSKAGAHINVHGSVVPVMENERFSGTMGFFRNITDLHREREQRVKSETRLQQTLDDMGIGCIILDFDYSYIFVNKAAATQAFQTPDCLIGKKMREMYPGVEKSQVFAKYRQAMEERISVNFEEKYVFANGNVKWFEFKVEPVEQGIFILSSDITERKKASEEIRKSRMLLADSQRLAQLGSWELNLLTHELVWTDEIYRIAEIEKTEGGAPFDKFLDLIHPEDRMNRDALFKESIANHTRYDTIHRLLFPDGRTKFIRVQAETFYGDDGTPMRALGMVQDITKQREAELRSLENEHKYRQVVSNITDGLFIDDLEGRVTFANEVFLQVFGLDASDINHIVIEDYVAPESAVRIRKYHNDRIAGLPAPEFYEYEGMRKDGSRLWLQVRVSKVYEHGILKGTQTALRDITERKKAEDLLAAQNAELKKINSELDRFVYSTSHDLRAPLLSLIGLIDLCKGSADKEELDSFIHMMEKSAVRLDNTIKEILEYSRNSRMELYFEEVDMPQMVDDLLEDIIHHDKAQRVTFTKHISTAVPFVTDRLRLATIMNNLVGNAVKYQRANEPHPTVDIAFSADENGGTLTVTDNGEGISANMHEKVFEMFYRNSQNSVGSGLGLYLCREIVQKMDGEIKLISEFGKGSTFIVWLPNDNRSTPDK